MVKRRFLFIVLLAFSGVLTADSVLNEQIFFSPEDSELKENNTNEYFPYVTLDETFTIDQAIQLALNHNPDLQEQMAAMLKASGILRQAKGNFDVKIGAETSYDEKYTPMDKNNPSGKSGEDILYQTIYGQDLTSKAYVEKLFAFGINTRLNYQLQRTKQEYKDGLYELDPYYAAYGHPNYNNTGTISLEVSVPLLKGFKNAIADNNLQIAELNYNGMAQNVEDTMAKVIMQTSESYWKLYIAYEKLQMLEQLYQSNQLRVENIEKLVNAGVRTISDQLRLKVNLLDVQRQMETARIDYGTAKVNLAVQIGVPVEKITKPGIVLPEIDFDGEFPTLEEFNKEKLTQIAFSRPDILSLVYMRDSAELKVKNARTSTMPDLDLKVHIGTNGAAYGWGADKFFFAANHNVRKLDYGGSLTFSMPIQNNDKKGQLIVAESELADAEAKLNKQKNVFMLQLMNAVSALNSYRDTISTAKNVLDLQSEVYAYETKRYETGLSSVDNLIQQDSNWMEANINFYQIYETYLKYVMEYKYYTTGLLSIDAGTADLYSFGSKTQIAVEQSEQSEQSDEVTDEVKVEEISVEAIEESDGEKEGENDE